MVEITPDIELLISQWDQAKKQSDYWTTQEATLRQQLFRHLVPQPTVGRNTVKLTHGMAAICEYRVNYKLHVDILPTLPTELVTKFVEFKPTLNKSSWLNLTDNERKTCADAVTETPGMPALELKQASKVRKW